MRMICVDQFLTMMTHDYLLMFTNQGKVYRIKGYQVPLASRTSKGIPIVNLLNLDKDEKVLAMVPVERENSPAKFLSCHSAGHCQTCPD